MRKKSLWMIAILVFVTSPLWSFDLESGAPKGGWKTEDIVTLRDQMHRMEDAYADIDGDLSKQPPDFAAIADKLDRMQGIAKMIQKVNGNAQLDDKFKKLLKDIQDLRVDAKARHRSGLENGVSNLFENCFGCHMTHSPARPAKTVPER